MTAPVATETAIVVPVPQAETAVGEHRNVLDRAAAWGVPAHVTVLYPFLPPAQLNGQTLDRVGVAAGRLTATTATFAEVRWFDERVVYLAPEPAQWFRFATEVMVDAFPNCLPYDGAFDEVIPHLTIGDADDHQSMQAAAEAVRAHLPIHALVDRLWVMQGTTVDASWAVIEEIPLTNDL
jgi:hypothetical protein